LASQPERRVGAIELTTRRRVRGTVHGHTDAPIAPGSGASGRAGDKKSRITVLS